MRYLIVTTLVAVLFCCCAKEESGIPAPGLIVCKVDDVNYSGPGAGAQISGVTSLSGNDNGKILNISIGTTNFTPPDTFIIQGGSATTVGSYSPDNMTTTYSTQVLSGEVGKIIVTEFTSDRYLKGTFEFKAAKMSDTTDVVEITEGGFNVKIQ
ncbi:MAG: DUF6252 family protein [candidate division WOR-3 bacterium]